MLNWRIEEEQYIHNKLKEYKTPFIFCLFKDKGKEHLNKFVDNARLEYRKDKLDSILLEVEKERKKIDNLVNDLNSKFEDYMYKQSNLISRNIKPFKVKISDGEFSPLEQLEVVSIQSEPFKMSFIQEKLPSDLVEKVKE